MRAVRWFVWGVVVGMWILFFALTARSQDNNADLKLGHAETAEGKPPIGHADQGANIKLMYVRNLLCVAKDELGKPRVELGPKFECHHAADDPKWICTDILVTFIVGCEEVKVVHLDKEKK